MGILELIGEPLRGHAHARGTRWIISLCAAGSLILGFPEKPQNASAPGKRIVPEFVEPHLLLEGALEPAVTVSVIAASDGTASEILAPVGTQVAAGQPVVGLEPAFTPADLEEAQHTLDSAYASLQSRRLEYSVALDNLQYALPESLEQTKQVLIDSAGRLERDYIAAETAAERLDHIERSIARQTLRATLSGVVTAVEIQPGARVSAGAIVAEISALDRLAITAQISASDLARLRNARSISVQSPADGAFAYPGDRISPQTCSEDERCDVRIEFKNPGHLKPGMSARVKIVTGPSRSALLVPRESLTWFDGSEAGILLLTEAGRSEHQIQIGEEILPGKVEVLSGIAPGTLVAGPAPASP